MKIILILLFCLFSFLSFAQDDLSKRENPRQYMNDQSCNAFFTPFEPSALIPFNDGVGIQITEADKPGNFKNNALKLFEKYGEEDFYKGRFVLTGIDMLDAKATKLKYLDHLEDAGLDSSRIDFEVMSYPFAKLINKLDPSGIKYNLKVLRNRFSYHFLPSKIKDIQKVYFKQKTIPALMSAAWIETFGLAMIAISPAMTVPERASLLLANVGLFYLYSRYMDSWLNWLFRPGSPQAIGFAKQMSLSIPFVIAYAIFGNVTDISQFITMAESLKEVVAELGNQAAMIAPFAIKTAAIAGLWHRLVNTNILGGWYNSQKGLGNIKEVQAFNTMEKTRRFLGVPFSLMFFFSALPSAVEVFNLTGTALGSFNAGHLAMMSYTAATIAAFKIYKARTGKNLMDFFNSLKVGSPKVLKTWKKQLKMQVDKIRKQFPQKRNP